MAALKSQLPVELAVEVKVVLKLEHRQLQELQILAEAEAAVVVIPAVSQEVQV